MIQVTDLKPSVIFLEGKSPYKVLGYDHIKVARGGAIIKIKAQDLITGTIKLISFNNGDKVQEADIVNKNLQFLYSDEKKLHFMDMETYEECEVLLSSVENEAKYLSEGLEFQVTFFNQKPLAIVLAPSMFFKVTNAPEGAKGNTATSAMKKVILENGLEVEAPLFIKEGDVLKINTTTGQYTGRGN